MQSPVTYNAKQPECSRPNHMALALRKLQRVLEQCQDIVFVTDHAGIITRVNPAFEQMTGYSSLEAVGTDLSCITSGGAQSSAYSRVWAQIFAESAFHGLLIFQTKGGGIREAEVTITPIRDRKGVITALIGTGRQVKRALPDEQHAEKAVTLAHELGNVMTSVSANAELALTEVSPEYPAWSRLHAIRDASQRAIQLLRSFLETGKSFSGIVLLDSLAQNVCGNLKHVSGHAAGENGSPAPHKSSAQIDSRRGNATVLLVDDDALIREGTAEFLSKSGYQVVPVASAEEALIAMHSQRDFQLVITDVVLPHMSGPQLAAALASIKPGIKVLLISGYPEDVVLRGASAEAELHFLQKPFSSQALRRKVREMLGQNQTFGAAAGGAG